MNYDEYVKVVNLDRDRERKVLNDANESRREAHLPLYDIEHEISNKIPLKSKEEFDDEQSWFKFRDDVLKDMPTPDEVYESTGRSPVQTHSILQTRNAKLKAAWKAKKGLTETTPSDN